MKVLVLILCTVDIPKMILIKSEFNIGVVKKTKTQFYRYAGVGKPLENWVVEGDRLIILQKRWEWVYAMHIDKEGHKIQGWLSSQALY